MVIGKQPKVKDTLPVGWVTDWLEKVKIEQSSVSAGLTIAELVEKGDPKSAIYCQAQPKLKFKPNLG